MESNFSIHYSSPQRHSGELPALRALRVAELRGELRGDVPKLSDEERELWSDGRSGLKLKHL